MVLLIDAIYINNSGGLVLLRYLINEVLNRKLKVHFLLDERIRGYNLVSGDQVTYLIGAEKNRNDYYKREGNRYSHVLCFGNIPPTIRLNAKVYTFFQNVILLSLPKQVPFLQRPKWLVKRLYIWKQKKNTDFWIVQTSNTQDLLAKKLHISNRIIICPFFDESKFPENHDNVKGRTDYSFVAKCIPVKNHELLIKGWIKLAKRNLFPVLHLTISDCPEKINALLEEACHCGCKIINHGFCNMDEVKDIYMHSKAVVYTSLNESFGLGMIEAMNMGCDVIAPDLPYATSICGPSEMFDYNAESLSQAIERYEKGFSKKTTNKVRNRINDFIELISH